MKNREEQIKEFLSDEKNLKALANDEELIGKVLDGKDTIETYVSAFKKLGLELSTDEARATQKVVEKIMDSSLEEIDESVLESISGGGEMTAEEKNKVYGISIAIPFTAWVGTWAGLMTGGVVYGTKANLARKRGDNAEYKRCRDKMRTLFRVGTGVSTFGISEGAKAILENLFSKF